MAINVTSHMSAAVPRLDGMDAATRPHGPMLALAAVYGALLAVIGLWPRHVDASLSLADWSLTRRLAELITLTPHQLVAAGVNRPGVSGDCFSWLSRLA